MAYFITIIVISLSALVTLIFKSELERMFREEKEVFALHVCNVIIILMTAFTTQAVMAIYVFGQKFNFVLSIPILLLIILPIYLTAHFFFKKYKSVYRKYENAGDGKILVPQRKVSQKEENVPAVETLLSAI